MYLFAVSHHYIDIACNIKYLNAEFDLNIIDFTSGGKFVDDETLYNLGFNLNIFSVIMMLYSTIYLTLKLRMMYGLAQK